MLILNSNYEVFDYQDTDSQSPLARAILKDDLPAVKKLLRKKHQPQSPDNRGMTPVHVAAALGNVRALRLLLHNKCRCTAYLANLVTWTGETPLLTACSQEQVSEGVVRCLLENGADPNKASYMKVTPLQNVCRLHGSIPLVHLLVAYGANVNARDDASQDTALHHAVRAQDLATVEFLCDVCDRATFGAGASKTPLMLACEDSSLPMVEALLRRGSYAINRVSKDMDTALTAAICGSGDLAMVTALLDAGADPNVHGLNEFLPIHWAVRHLPVLQLLLPLTDPRKLVKAPPLGCHLLFNAPPEFFFEVAKFPFGAVSDAILALDVNNVVKFFLSNDDCLDVLRTILEFYLYLDPGRLFNEFGVKICSSEDPLASFQSTIPYLLHLAKLGWWGLKDEYRLPLLEHCDTVVALKQANSQDAKDLRQLLQAPQFDLRKQSAHVARKWISNFYFSQYGSYRAIHTAQLPAEIKCYLLLQVH